MADYFYVRVDQKRLREHLAALTGKRCSAAQADTWLKEQGFEPIGEIWRADNVDLSELLADEIVAVVPQEEVTGAPEHALDGIPKQSMESLMVEAFGPGAPEIFARPPAPALSDAEVAELRAMPDYEQCLVPRFLVGPHRLVKRRCDSIVRRAVRDRTWSKVLQKEEFVHVDELGGWIIVDRGSFVLDLPKEEFPDVRLYTMLPQLHEHCWAEGDLNRNQDYEVRNATNYMVWRAMVVEGLDSFWFSLVFLAGGDAAPPKVGPIHEQDRADFARACVRKSLRWWSHIAARSERFVRSMWDKQSWPMWGLSPAYFALLGLSTTWEDLKKMSPSETAAILSNAVR